VAQTVTTGEQKVCPESESLKFSATPTPQVENSSDSHSSTPTPQSCTELVFRIATNEEMKQKLQRKNVYVKLYFVTVSIQEHAMSACHVIQECQHAMSSKSMSCHPRACHVIQEHAMSSKSMPCQLDGDERAWKRVN